jgi:hypothetical protein
MQEYRICHVASKSTGQIWDEAGGFWDETGGVQLGGQGGLIHRLTQIYTDYLRGSRVDFLNAISAFIADWTASGKGSGGPSNG